MKALMKRGINLRIDLVSINILKKPVTVILFKLKYYEYL